ncbi:MAG TPA: penicillin-binding protein 2 [Sphingobacteriaceae bacterium]
MNSFFARKFVIQAIFIAVALLLLIRLFYIQVLNDKYYLSAENNVLRKVIVYPARGIILDRNNKILVQNEPVYDLMVIPREVKPFDTLELCRLLDLEKEAFDKKFKKAKNYSPYRASIFEKQLSATTYARLQEKLYDFSGFFVQNRTVRHYPDSIAGQFLGYIGEVNDKIIEQSGGFYRPGDYIGISGVEKAYEELLRGQRGVQNVMVDAFNRPKGHFADGAYDTIAVSGERLISSLDIRIQKLGEQLMKNKVGSIVAIEPSTGEILAFVSSPSYDPNLLVGRERGNNVAKLYQDPYKPFLIRPIQARYSPGSSFKPIDGLIALQQGLIDPKTTFYCPGGYRAGNHWVRCEHVDGTTDLAKAIKMSCNTYFCYIFDKLITVNGPRNIRPAFNAWRDQVMKFGLGSPLNIDLPAESRGLVPTDEHYDKVFGKNRWRSSSIISLAIGQGELLTTPLQMANMECIIANRGFYYTPHLIKAIGNKKIVKPEFTVKHDVGIDPRHFEPVIDGMQQVVESGTAYYARIPNITLVGKTGTVQNPHGKNHSVFVAFAPRVNPKIAIAVVVENAGYGSSWAAPIASFIVEKYLTDSISKPKAEVDFIINSNLLPFEEKPKEKIKIKKSDTKSSDTSSKPKPEKPVQPVNNTKAVIRND